MFFCFFNLIKSETSASFVNHFDGHFAYLMGGRWCVKKQNKKQVEFLTGDL